MSLTRLLPLSLLLLSLAACDTLPQRSGSSPTGGVVTGTAQAGPAPNDNLNAIAWMQTSVEFRLIAGQTWRGALVQLDKAIKTPGWDALTKEDRSTPAAGLPKAIIVDIDETMLDNTPYRRGWSGTAGATTKPPGPSG